MSPTSLLELLQLFGRPSFLRTSAKNESSGSLVSDRYLRRLLWYLFAGTRGGPSRAEIIRVLRDRPCNANQLAQSLKVDYKTIQHHIGVLEEHGLVAPSEKGAYGAVLFLTPKMEEATPILNEIWSKIGRSKISEQTKEDAE